MAYFCLPHASNRMLIHCHVNMKVTAENNVILVKKKKNLDSCPVFHCVYSSFDIWWIAHYKIQKNWKDCHGKFMWCALKDHFLIFILIFHNGLIIACFKHTDAYHHLINIEMTHLMGLSWLVCLFCSLLLTSVFILNAQ